MQAIAGPFLIIIMSWLAFRRGWIDFEMLPAFRFLILKIALPAFVFSTFVREKTFFEPTILLTVIAASGLLYGAYFLVGKLILHWPIERAMLFGHSAVATNALLLGVPIFSLMFGHEIDLVVSQIIIFENVLLVPAFLVVADYSMGVGRGFRAVWRSLARNQFLIVIIIAMLVVGLKIPLPAFVDTAVNLVGRAAAPVALITVGGILAKTQARSYMGVAVLATIGKLFVLPLLTLSIGTMFGLDRMALVILVLFAALPNAATLPIFGEQVEFPELSNSVFIIGYVFAFFTLSAWVVLLT